MGQHGVPPATARMTNLSVPWSHPATQQHSKHSKHSYKPHNYTARQLHSYTHTVHTWCTHMWKKYIYIHTHTHIHTYTYMYNAGYTIEHGAPQIPKQTSVSFVTVSSSEVLVLDLAFWLQEGRSLCLLSPRSGAGTGTSFHPAAAEKSARPAEEFHQRAGGTSERRTRTAGGDWKMMKITREAIVCDENHLYSNWARNWSDYSLFWLMNSIVWPSSLKSGGSICPPTWGVSLGCDNSLIFQVVHLLQIEAQQCSFARVLCQSQINDLCCEILATQIAGDPPNQSSNLASPSTIQTRCDGIICFQLWAKACAVILYFILSLSRQRNHSHRKQRVFFIKKISVRICFHCSFGFQFSSNISMYS